MVTKKPTANVRALDRLVVEYYTMPKYASDNWPSIGVFLSCRGVLAVNAKTVPNICLVQGAWGLRAYLRGLARGKP